MTALHDFVYATDPLGIDAEYDNRLDGLLHELLESLFYQDLRLTDLFGCPTDVILVLQSLKEDGSFAGPSRVTFACAVLQYFVRTTVIHTLRLHSGGHDEYVPLSDTTLPATDNHGQVLDDDDDIVPDNDGSFMRYVWSIMKLSLVGLVAKFAFIRRLHELRKFMLPSAQNGLVSTPYSHAKKIWCIAAEGLRKERSEVKLAWTPSKDEFEYSRPGITQAHITFSALRQMIHGNEEQLLEQFVALLPSSFPISAVDSLPWDTLKDDTSKAESFLDAEGTWNDWMKDAVDSMKRAYLDDSETRHRISAGGKPSLTAFKNNLLELDRKFQDTLVGAIVGDTGVSPRAINLCNLAYRSDGKVERNLHMPLDSIVLTGGRQKGESRRDGERHFVLRAMSPQSGKILVRYLALVRRAIVEIMKENNWYTNSISAYETRIFAKPSYRKGASGIWEVSEITAAWHACSVPFLGTRLSIVDMRQITTGIFREHFPDFLRESPAESTALDVQGDHGPSTNKNHYGRSNRLSHANSAPDTHDCIQASRIYQAMMHVFSLDNNWPASVLSSSIFNPMQHESLALDVAQYLIREHYGFGQVQADAVRTLLDGLYNEFPFLFTSEVC